MLVTLFGIVMDAKLEHIQKAPLPMLATPFGIVMEVKPEQPEKAELPILVTLFGIKDFWHPANK